ncbi:cytochrome P450 [Chytriomyces cf. hyalinus JEL632]|nr:cytochrome P450 [Chytriomyces cf. hyalinus JEL632]
MTGSTNRSGYLLPAIAGATAAAGILTYLYRNEAICSTGRTDQKVARVGGDVPFFGDLFTALARLETVQDFYADTFEKTGNATFVFKIPFSPNNYVFNNPEILEFVLKTHFSVFDKGTRSYDLMYDLLGNGIFNVDGEAWRTQRKLAANIFNVKNFKDHVDSVFVDQEVAFSRAVQLHIEASREFDVADLFYRLSFDTFAQIAFGVNMNSMLSHECIDIMTALDAVQKRIAHRFIDAFWRTTEYISGESKVHKREIQLIRDFVQDIIQKNRVSGVSENDLLSLLMKVDDQLGKVPSDDELIYYVLNFLIAGRESTAASLGWSVLLLSKHPRVLDSLLDEINSTSNGERPTYEQIKNGMPYAKAVMRETMRLYPPVPLNIKMANTDITLPDGTFVPKGASVSWSVYAMGRTEEIWGPDAKEYRPERWLEMNKQPSPYNYPVFQAGPRVCLGQQMAELQVVYMLVQFVRNFKFEVVDPDSVTYTYSLTLRMKNGLKVRCQPRN